MYPPVHKYSSYDMHNSCALAKSTHIIFVLWRAVSLLRRQGVWNYWYATRVYGVCLTIVKHDVVSLTIAANFSWWIARLIGTLWREHEKKKRKVARQRTLVLN